MTEPEGPSLAAFFSQPADEDEPETTLAAFYAQPADDEAKALDYVIGYVVAIEGEQHPRIVWVDS